MIRRPVFGLLAGLSLGCAGPVEPEEPPVVLGVADARQVKLVWPDEPAGPRRFGLSQLQRLPVERMAAVWVGDVPLLDRDERLGLLSALLNAPPPEAPLDAHAAGVAWRDLALADVDWAASAVFGPLVAAGEALGFDGVALLAQALDITLEAPVLERSALARALAGGLVASHPLAARRPGDAGADRPIAPGALPLSLADLLVGEGGALAARLGPHHAAGAYHPGVVTGVRLPSPPDDLQVTVRLAQPPALHAALDLERAAAARVPALGAAEGLIDPAAPDWLRIEGSLSPDLVVPQLSVAVPLDPRPLDGRTWTGGAEPAPTGRADGWTAAPWTLDALSLQAAWSTWREAGPRQVGWPAGAPTVDLRLDAGWLGLTGPGLPVGAYVWEAVAEGARRAAAAVPAVALVGQDMPVGLDGEAWRAEVVAALAAQPEVVAELVLALLAPVDAVGTDLYVDGADGGPWLVAVAPAEQVPGPRFFGDAALTQPLDARDLGPGGRPRTPIRAGGTVYMIGDSGGLFRLEVERFEVDGPVVTVTRVR